MSIIEFLVVLCFLGAIVRVAWGAFKFLFVLVALLALLHITDERSLAPCRRRDTG
jgi:hypothetical protein